jgi:hypothetical protein
MSQDTDMSSKVRRIVTGNWVDVSQVRIRVTRGVVNLQGHISSVTGDPATAEGSEADMRRIDDEIRILKGFRGVSHLLDNWVREASGGWRCLGRKREKSGKRDM